MSKKSNKKAGPEPEGYKETLHHLQVELVKLQRHLIKNDLRILVLFEGRDASGKDGVIKRITAHLSPRETRIVALGKPSDEDRASWYFKRYVASLPARQEMVIMNRSWYNRAGVEKVMGFCTAEEHEEFMRSVLPFERMLVGSGTQLFKYYLDISKPEQKKRLADRRIDPLKQWKISPIDKGALRRWDDYSAARNEMFTRTHSEDLPWHVVRADNKKLARLNVIRHLMTRVDCPDKDTHKAQPDPEVVFDFADEHIKSGAIVP
ncbi:MAG: polyphosphate kinase 2 [Hoeflea sp.]|uniref:polyphosphate kinase 2 n=1 Tax=Hoeflea sp. TaxID=1940281 RepID=UPI001E0DA6C3|nr:polyphosphate kinase 2 [Hoeflea sp.]MBU4529293.1 polyphosphate kinase 2 [Alphaproteobacteria bacterium]MBU4545460.1 polyphosphate kinase 2 [Alphaproteobacteria bacterium]MBU4550175.1 polyphosphate kinase 2 [Alphaproteobacteria bacterium]MBV1723216.1 polyphosphate kinase 2 [Hoeflea sp.]MBV1782889.1 polyphosphate kinase 2 [Hoeflea sp.]